MARTELFARSGKPPRRVNSLLWLFEAFEHDPGYVLAPMFGCQAAYLDERLCLVVADRGAPWNGLLVCTSHEHHAALRAALPALRPHEVLGKWLYVAQDDPAFEETADGVVALATARDARIGVQAKGRKRS